MKKVETNCVFSFCRMDTPNGWRLVSADVTNERATLRNLLETCAVAGLLCFAAFLGASILLAAWMVKPADKARSRDGRSTFYVELPITAHNDDGRDGGRRSSHCSL